MPLSSTEKQHPIAWDEVLPIAGCGPGPHLHALAEFAAVFDSLFDGTQFPTAPYLGASGSLQASFDERHDTGALIVFYRVFWGDDRCWVVAALCEAAFARPVLMAMTAFGLACGPGAADVTAAIGSVTFKAVLRSVDL
ncbi:MAG: hypothetical protein JSR42_20985 [Proteobacteria bacterium]|nr:hypothetical protein [Pseudomonadota bacterium]